MVSIDIIKPLGNVLASRGEPSDDSRPWWQSRHIVPNIAAAMIGLVLSVAAWAAVSVRGDRLADLELGARANSHALILQSGINEYTDRLAALHALFQSDNEVTRHEFTIFTDYLLRDQTAVLAFSWIPRVTKTERVAHELSAARDGLPRYRIKSLSPDGKLLPSAERSEYFPVLYTSNEPPDSPVYGLDLNDGGLRQQTLERARDSGRIATSANFVLRSGDGDRNGFFVVLPVYRQGLPHDSVQDRRSNLIGFVQGVFQTGVMIDSIIRASVVPQGLDLYFFDAKSAGDPPTLLYFHTSRIRTTAGDALPWAKLIAGPHWSKDFSVGDAQWLFVAAPIPGGPGTQGRAGAWLVLVGGLLVTAVVVANIWSSGRHAQRLQQSNDHLDRTLGALNVANEQLSTQNVRFDAALSNMSQALLMFDSSGRLMISNDRYYEMYGLSRDVVKPGCTIRELLQHRQQTGTSPGDWEAYLANLESLIARGEAFERIVDLPDGRTIAVVNRPMAGGGWVATHEDITERRSAEAKISYMANHDALTDLPNRVLFHEQLAQALASMKREESLAVFCLDIDNFKSVNDTLGHPVGDVLLREAAGRLRQCIREGDVVARLGGDEFAIVGQGASQPSDATVLAKRLIDVIGAPYDLDGQQVVVGLSVGIAVAPSDGTDPRQLLRNADMALYRAKLDGRSIYRFFEPTMDASMQARRTLELDLRKALANREFELFYQPFVNIRTGEISGFEALIRWPHPQRGMVLPLDFIPLAEETGLIVPIGEWVLREACTEAARWPPHLKVAANLSPIQFKSKTLMPAVMTAIATSGLSPNRLELEITESVLLQDGEATLALLHQLRDLGIRISMDDFGTGYSSLSYLRKFPFDKIKIDQSFIRDMAGRRDNLAIVRAIIAMGASLGIATTAEGVETREQLEQLRAEDCTEAQGYFFSPPKPATEINEMLAKCKPKLKAIA
jgi:diguanylate cyclase (GGDEF)-like protein/PAS domain S-box-containing protein